MEIESTFNNRSRQITIKAPVKDSLHASLLADRLNSTTYLKVFDRSFKNGVAIINAHTIKGVYTPDKLQEDLGSMESLMDIKTQENDGQ